MKRQQESDIVSVNSTEKSKWGRQTNQHQHRPSLAPVRWHQCYRVWWFLVAQAVVRYHLLVRRWAAAGSGLASWVAAPLHQG